MGSPADAIIRTWAIYETFSDNIWERIQFYSLWVSAIGIASLFICISPVCHVSSDGDGEGYLKCGTVKGVYPTIDFGPGTNVNQSFAIQREYAPYGPLVNTEFYPGWLDLWGSKHSTVSTASIVRTLNDMLSIGANVNFYMFFGGTNFGFTSGTIRSFDSWGCLSAFFCILSLRCRPWLPATTNIV